MGLPNLNANWVEWTLCAQGIYNWGLVEYFNGHKTNFRYKLQEDFRYWVRMAVSER